MFMRDGGSSFEDDVRRPSTGIKEGVDSLRLDSARPSSSRSRPMTMGGMSSHPNALIDEDEVDQLVMHGTDYTIGSRSSVIQQQRELQKKKLQERASGGMLMII